MNMKRTIILLTVISLAGCTSMRPMDVAEPGFVEQFEAGDHLVVHEKSGRVVDMTFVRADEGTLYGSWYGNGLSTVEVDIDQVLRVEVEKIFGGKTTAAVFGGLLLLPVVAAGAFAAGMAGVQ